MPGPCPCAWRDEGLRLAVAACGGIAPLARRLELKRSTVSMWRTTPQAHLFAIAKASGIDAEDLRPDLAGWIRLEEKRRWRARAAERLAAVAIGALPGRPPAAETEEGLRDLLVVQAAVSFAARERGVGSGRLWTGTRRPEESARAYAMALALVAARVPATAIAAVFGCTRQNVENAGERYLRARDGDDEDDQDEDGRVIERGRLRHAKAGDPALAAAETRFLELLDGKTDTRGRAA